MWEGDSALGIEASTVYCEKPDPERGTPHAHSQRRGLLWIARPEGARNELIIKFELEPDAIAGRHGVVQVRESFYGVDAEELKDIADAKAGLDIRFVAEGEGAGLSVNQWEFHQGGIFVRIIFGPDPPV